MGEAINLVNNFKVEKVIFNCGEYNNLESELIKVLDKKKIKHYSCISKLDNLYFLNTKEYYNENDNSNVIYTELNGYKFMLMGDASTTTEVEVIDEKDNEYWFARELMSVLGYSKWENFNKVIEKAIVACQNSSINYKEHFPDVRKTLEMPNNAMKKIIDYKLSRYACYLIAQNGDSRKEAIALAQTYFAIQTGKQELSDLEYNNLTEAEKRLYRRNQARKGNYNLNKTAVNSGVKDLARFHNAGYKGLYNGETADDIFKRKKLRYREDILDNIFRIAQTDSKLKRDNVDNEYTASAVHFEVGKEVRNSIKRLGGTMPEDLPAPDKSLKELEKKHRIKNEKFRIV